MNKILAIIISAAALSLAGCQTAQVNKTDKSGNTTSLNVKSFLSTIKNGQFAAGDGGGTNLWLGVTDAGPDQQSIAILAGGVVEMGKLFAGKSPTNSAPITTNAP